MGNTPNLHKNLVRFNVYINKDSYLREVGSFLKNSISNQPKVLFPEHLLCFVSIKSRNIKKKHAPWSIPLSYGCEFKYPNKKLLAKTRALRKYWEHFSKTEVSKEYRIRIWGVGWRFFYIKNKNKNLANKVYIKVRSRHNFKVKSFLPRFLKFKRISHYVFSLKAFNRGLLSKFLNHFSRIMPRFPYKDIGIRKLEKKRPKLKKVRKKPGTRIWV